MNEIGLACQRGEISARLSCVIASNKDASGIHKAKALGIRDEDILVIDPDAFREGLQRKINVAAFAEALIQALLSREVNFVFQNGWLPLTPKAVIDTFSRRIFNQHPGPVPECGGSGMYGRRVLAAALLFRRLTDSSEGTEIVAQEVAPKFDEGLVFERLNVPIFSDDTVESLQARVLPLEHKLQITLIQKLIAQTACPAPYRQPWASSPGARAQLATAKEMAKLLYPKG